MYLVNLQTYRMEQSNNQNPERSEGGKVSKRGFAGMDPEKQRSIASSGGKAAHLQGVAHRWTSAEASEAGRKGGQNSRSRTDQNGGDTA
jgi:general stress protein YciG